MSVMGEYVLFEVIGGPSIFKLIRTTSVLASMLPTLVLNCEDNVARRNCKNSQCSRPDVISIIVTDIKEILETV